MPKILNSRIQNKFATISEWSTVWETFKPLKGEIIKIHIPANTTVSGLDKSTSDRTMTKTGDGTTTLINLPWDSAVVSNETQLSKGSDKTSTKTLTHGGTFTAVVDTTVSGHQITDVTKTFTMPSETAISVDQGTATQVTPAHGGTVTVVSGVTKGDSSHNLDIAKTTIKLPGETSLSKGTDTTGTAKTLTHGGTFTAMTNTTVSGHKITDENTTFTLPTETTLSKGSDENVSTQKTLTHGGTFKALTDTKVSGHTVTDVITTFKMPSETAINPTTQSADAATLTHGGTFTALTAVSKGTNSHDLTFVPTTFTMPSMPTGAMVFKGTLGTNGTVTALPSSPESGWSYKVVTAGTYASNSCTVGDLLVYDGSAWVLIPSGDDEKKGTVTSVKTGQGLSGGTITSSGTIKHVDTTRTDTTSTLAAAHGDTVQVVDSVTTDTMGHVTAANVKTVTLPSETAVTVDGSTGTQQTPSHGGTFTVVKSVAKGDSSHNVDVVSTSVKLPAETAVSVDSATATKTLSHGGTVDVITSVAKGNTSHNVDVTTTTLTLPSETALGVDQLTGSQVTPAHDGTFTVVTGVVKGNSSHNLDVTKSTIKLPSVTGMQNSISDLTTRLTAAERALIEIGDLREVSSYFVSGYTLSNGNAVANITAEMFDTFYIHDTAGVYNVSVTYQEWSGVAADYRILAENTGAHVVTVSRKDGVAITSAELSTVNNTVEHLHNGFSVYFNKLHNIVLAQNDIDEAGLDFDTNNLISSNYASSITIPETGGNVELM